MSTRPLAFIVLGSHRSGTSPFTRVLTELGAVAPTGLLEPSSDNPDGYFESRRIVQLDNELLRIAGSSWFQDGPLPAGFFRRRRVRALRRRALRILREDLEGTDVFVLKDPRFSRLVPFWADVLDEFGAEQHWVLMLRHPVEVARSLELRERDPAFAHAAVTAPGQAYLLWLRYTLDAERDTRERARTILTFDGFLSNWLQAVRRVCDPHPGRLAGLLDPACTARVEDLVSPGRRRSRLDTGERLPDAYQAAVFVYEALCEHAEGRATLPEAMLDATSSGLDLAHAAYRTLRRDDARIRTDDPWGVRQLTLAFDRAKQRPRAGSERMSTRVFFVTGDPTARSSLYRVGNHVEALRSHGTRSISLPQTDVARARKEAGRSDVVILHRAPWSDDLAELIDHCRGLGVPVGFDVDDLLFVPELVTPACFDYLRGLDDASQHRWREHAERLRATLEATDFTIVSTESLAIHARAAGARTFVLPNALSARAQSRASRARLVRRCSWRDARVRIGYASGTPTHRRDFAQIAGAMARTLEANANVVFVALGFLEIDDYPDLAPYHARIERRPVVPYADLPRELARFDINLAPLEVGNPFCEAKSELKYFEAGGLGIPTAASSTDVYRNAIEDGVNGRLAATPDEWTRVLLELSTEEAMRRDLGETARRHVRGLYGPEATRRNVRCLHEWIHTEFPSRSAR